MEPLLLTLPQASDALNIGKSTLYNLIKENKLAVVYVGRSARVPLESLNDYIASLPTGLTQSEKMKRVVRGLSPTRTVNF